MKRHVWLAALLFPLALAGTARAAMPSHPAIRVTTMDGKPYDLAAERGHWVIVNFWATWCVPCVAEMPALSRYVATHKGVRAIGLAYEDSDPADIKAFLARHPVVYPVAQVTLDKPVKDFDEPRGLPTTYLIAPDGTVAAHFLGPIDAARLDAAINKAK
ncbi:TlpA disulfide reductase family protein [Rhodanobacter sp. DHB23]|uniref:TlpA family protein disulfide reductase n=1 Tax=Rhodanobacter sp. DHB23 TaxID=2775923 RepID=UPI00177BF892|nr:TlpA disulfide reductase family protein [Rhodanobacter sp. DHB23]MBD8873203.1 TlpA family protein disulfide reductase [Rhodanobacter sp. DHB23]